MRASGPLLLRALLRATLGFVREAALGPAAGESSSSSMKSASSSSESPILAVRSFWGAQLPHLCQRATGPSSASDPDPSRAGASCCCCCPQLLHNSGGGQPGRTKGTKGRPPGQGLPGLPGRVWLRSPASGGRGGRGLLREGIPALHPFEEAPRFLWMTCCPSPAGLGAALVAPLPGARACSPREAADGGSEKAPEAEELEREELEGGERKDWGLPMRPVRVSEESAEGGGAAMTPAR